VRGSLLRRRVILTLVDLGFSKPADRPSFVRLLTASNTNRSVGGEREKGVSEEPGLYTRAQDQFQDQSVERIMRVAVEAARFRCQ